MTFLHKLAQRLARMKTALIMGAVAMIACEIPLATDPSSVAMVEISPKTSSLRTGQIAQFVVIGLTSTGDTAKIGVRWSATGGTIIDTSTSGGKHYGHYKSPNQPGQYKVVGQSSVAALGDSAVVTVTAVPVASVSVSPASASTMVGQTVQLTATPVDSTGAALSGRVVTWASSNSGIATVSASGLVTGLAAGSATITATSEGKSGTATVTVTPVPVASVSVSPGSATVGAGQTVQLSATPKDASGNPLTGRIITWASSNTAVATVSGSGLVAGVAAGSVTITATSEGQSGTATVTVAVPVASVTVSPASASVVAGQTVQLTATPQDASGNPLTGRIVTWASSNTAVARVNGSGLVSGVGAGSATITATSEGKSGTAAVTVTPVPVASVSVSPATASVSVGQTVQLTATPRDASGNPLTGRIITWASSNAGLATVSGSGLVAGVAAGSATITATSEGKSGAATVAVAALPPPGTTWPNEPAGLPLRSDHAWAVADMTSAGSAGWRNAYPSDYPSLVTIASDATAPLGDTGNILEFIYPLGYDAGTSPGTIYYAFSPSLAEVYLAFWWKADSNWENGPGDTNKMAYIHNQGGSGQIWVAMSSSDHTTFVYSGQVQGINLYANVNADVVSLGVWHRIELHVKLQQAGVASSTVEWWMDNRLQGRYTNINPLDRAINDVQFAPVWGGVGAIKQRGPNYFWFDHVRLSGQ